MGLTSNVMGLVSPSIDKVLAASVVLLPLGALGSGYPGGHLVLPR